MADNLDLDALEAIGIGAEPGPWWSTPTVGYPQRVWGRNVDRETVLMAETFIGPGSMGGITEDGVRGVDGNAMFIAAARNNWQAMIDALREAADRLEQADTIIESLAFIIEDENGNPLMPRDHWVAAVAHIESWREAG